MPDDRRAVALGSHLDLTFPVGNAGRASGDELRVRLHRRQSQSEWRVSEADRPDRRVDRAGPGTPPLTNRVDPEGLGVDVAGSTVDRDERAVFQHDLAAIVTNDRECQITAVVQLNREPVPAA